MERSRQVIVQGARRKPGARHDAMLHSTPSIRRNITSLRPGSLHFVELISSTTEQFVIAAHALLCSPVSSFSKPLSHYSLFLSPSLWVEARGKKVSSVCFKLLLRSESCVGRFGEHKHNAVLPNWGFSHWSPQRDEYSSVDDTQPITALRELAFSWMSKVCTHTHTRSFLSTREENTIKQLRQERTRYQKITSKNLIS